MRMRYKASGSGDAIAARNHMLGLAHSKQLSMISTLVLSSNLSLHFAFLSLAAVLLLLRLL